jgi:hypothetical protein
MSAPTNGGNGADRKTQRRLWLRHMSDADLRELAREVYEEAQQRAREARDIAALFPAAFQKRCPVCHSPGCVSEQCRREERRRSRWRHVAEPAPTGDGDAK